MQKTLRISAAAFASGALLILVAGCGKPAEPDRPSAPATPAAPASAPATPVPRAPAQVPLPIFFEAAAGGDLEAVSVALKSGVDSNARDEQNHTALMLAAFDGHTRVVELLLDHRCAIDALDDVGRTALMYASSGPNIQTVHLLLQRGAAVNIIDTGEHWTSLMFAAAEGHEDIVRALLEKGADPTLKDVDGDTARNFALQRGQQAVATLLEDAEKNWKP